MKKRRFQEGGSTEDEDKAEGLRRSSKEKVGFLKRLRMGNIDDPESEAYKRFGAGRGRSDRMREGIASLQGRVKAGSVAPDEDAKPVSMPSVDSGDFVEAGSGVGDVVRKPTPRPPAARPTAARPAAKPPAPAPMRVGTGSGRGGQGGPSAGDMEAYYARLKAPASAPAAARPAAAPAAPAGDQYSGRARLKQMFGTAESRAGVEPDIKAEDIAAAKAAGESKREKYREDLLAPIKRLAARAGTQEMREKYKAEGYAKGGKVRGDGICQRGKTKGTMR